MSAPHSGRRASPFVAAAVLLLLTACGGGGGGGADGSSAGAAGGSGSSGSGPANVPFIAISTANQNAVAADALANLTNGSGALTGTILLTGVQVDRTSAAPRIPLLAEVIRRFAVRAAAQPAQATGAAVNQSRACSQGGSLAITGSVADANQFTSGDTLTLTATHCPETVNNAPATLNGSMRMNVLGGLIGGNTFQVTIQVTFTGFAVQSDGATVTTDGDMQLVWNYTNASYQFMEASGTRLATSVVSGGITRSETWNDYDQQIQLSGSDTGYQLVATIFSLTPAFGPDPVAYQIIGGVDYDSASSAFTSGIITVEGVDARLQFGVHAPNVFTLVLDANSDGTPDNLAEVPLSDLQSAL